MLNLYLSKISGIGLEGGEYSGTGSRGIEGNGTSEFIIMTGILLSAKTSQFIGSLK